MLSTEKNREIVYGTELWCGKEKQSEPRFWDVSKKKNGQVSDLASGTKNV